MEYQMPCFSNFAFYPHIFHPSPQNMVKVEEKTFQLHVFVEKEQKIERINICEKDLEELGYANKKKRWTQEEDQKLLKFLNKPEKDWEEISKLFPGRNPKMCYNRYRRLSCSIQRSWTEQDDKKIIELVNQHGENWKRIKELFPKRNQKQIKDHYHNYLRPDIDKSEWNLETDMEFLRLLSQYGCDWLQIQKHMPQRPYPHIKNRYYGRIAKIIAKKLEIQRE